MFQGCFHQRRVGIRSTNIITKEEYPIKTRASDKIPVFNNAFPLLLDHLRPVTINNVSALKRKKLRY